MSQDARWHIFGDYRIQFASGMNGMLMSRPFLEWQIWQRVWQLPNLQVLDQTRVMELIATPDQTQVTGVRIQSHSSPSSPRILTADLVVDASGRGTAAPRWLAALGYAAPPETQVTVNVGYATRLFRRHPEDLKGAKLVIISPDPPVHQRSGVIFPIEGDRWIVTLASWGGEDLPLDPQSFEAFARSLPAPDIYNLISRAEPISEVIGYKYPASLRRHYEKLRRFPAGLLLIGDALCSFNPTYGQGMTSAALQVQALDQLLRSQPHPHRLAEQFFHHVAKIIDIPWQLAVGEDFRFPKTVGPKSPGTDLLNRYANYLHRASHTDSQVYTAFLRVMNLLEPPLSLVHPQIAWRVWRAYRQRPKPMNPKVSEPPKVLHS